MIASDHSSRGPVAGEGGGGACKADAGTNKKKNGWRTVHSEHCRANKRSVLPRKDCRGAHSKAVPSFVSTWISMRRACCHERIKTQDKTDFAKARYRHSETCWRSEQGKERAEKIEEDLGHTARQRDTGPSSTTRAASTAV
jgi:hypothetical protein